MRKKFNRIASIIMAALMVCSQIGAALAAPSKQATLDYTGIKITLNGNEIVPSDANGNAVEPFAISGTTYLPVRGIASALGMSVVWDQATQTVSLTSNDVAATPVVTTQARPARHEQATLEYPGIKIVLDGKAVVPTDAAGNVVEPFAISGSTFLPVRGVASALGLDVQWEQSTQTVVLTSGEAPNSTPTPPASTTAPTTTTAPISTTAPVVPPAATTAPATTTAPVATTAPTTTTAPAATTAPTQGNKIYVTKTGKKYHYDPNCNGGTYYESTLEDAKSRGLTPCSKCVLK